MEYHVIFLIFRRNPACNNLCIVFIDMLLITGMGVNVLPIQVAKVQHFFESIMGMSLSEGYLPQSRKMKYKTIK